MRKLMITAVLAALLGCSSEPEPESDTASDTSADQQPSRDHVLADQYKALDDAKKLQDEVNAQVEQRLKELDEQSKVKKDDG